jgi:hypothetical protein
MPAVSKAQQRFMGMVHATQKGDMKNPSSEIEKAADSMKKKDAKDFASTSHKGLPDHKKEQINKLKEVIRKMVRERMIEEESATGNVDGYNSPYAFSKKGHEKEKAKKQASLTGYTAVNEEDDTTPNKSVIANTDTEDKKKDKELTKVSSMEFVKDLHENRWLALKNEESSAESKIGRGISNINKQLAEMERFLNWYGKIKNESGVDNKSYWKRTNGHIYSIQERLLKLDQKIRQISE